MVVPQVAKEEFAGRTDCGTGRLVKFNLESSACQEGLRLGSPTEGQVSVVCQDGLRLVGPLRARET